MKYTITIDIDASDTIIETIRRGSFTVDNDGSGHKIRSGDRVVVPRRKCNVTFTDNQKPKQRDDKNGVTKDEDVG